MKIQFYCIAGSAVGYIKAVIKGKKYEFITPAQRNRSEVIDYAFRMIK